MKNDGWTENPDEALYFESITEAVQMFLKFRLKNAELVYVPDMKNWRSLPGLRTAQSNWASHYGRGSDGND